MAKFYAVGYTNGGANEKRLGPFDNISDAWKSGQVEQGSTRRFSFAGVVDENGQYVSYNSRACNSSNPVVRKAMNKPYDIPMESDDDDKVNINLEEFTWQYGKRENPRAVRTTFDKLHSYLSRFGIESQESAIVRKLRKGESVTIQLPVQLAMVFSRP